MAQVIVKNPLKTMKQAEQILRSAHAGAAGVTRLSDVIVPEVFTPYVQQMTEQKSRLIASGVVARDPFIDSLLAGGGMTFNVPGYRDLDDDEENTSTDNPSQNSTPKKIQTAQEVAVRLSRNNSWSSMDLAATLIGNDPMDAIASRVSDYWLRRLQRMFIATVNGIFADNGAAPTGTDTHTQHDLTLSVAHTGGNVGGTVAAYNAATTTFGGENFIDALLTIGDSEDDLGIALMHSVVYARAKKQNLIDFIPDATGRVSIPTYMGRTVIVDDGLTALDVSNNIYQTWVFGQGAFRLGVGSPAVPTETEREASAGNGSGQEILHNRVEWAMHPAGHAYVGPTTVAGGPTNTELAAATSWSRVYSERKQIKIVRLVTREA